MARRAHHRGGFALLLVLAGCGGHSVTMTNTDGADSNTEECEGVLEYRDVCFHAHSVEPVGYQHPLELDGEPGHELVGVVDDGVVVYRFDGEGFVLVGEADAPPKDSHHHGVIAGEFDETPGLDLIVSETGEWAALYHLDEDGAPTLVEQTPLGSRAFEASAAVGPDAKGRWRIVARYDHADIPFDAKDPLALWEVQGATLVEVERLDVGVLGACEIGQCDSGEFNGDGRTDAVCTLDNVCLNDDPPEDDVVHVILLAQADGTITTTAYPTTSGESSIANDLDGDGITDLVGPGGYETIWYRLGDGAGGLGPVTRVDPLGPPPLHWAIVSAGDLDSDGDAEVVLGHELQALVFDDAVGAPQSYAMLEVNDASLPFPSNYVAIDVNADNIVDLPIQGHVPIGVNALGPRTLLVSERRP